MLTLHHLGLKHGTDKTDHKYLGHYDEWFSPIRHEDVTLLEIGVMEGKSLRMWRDYFSCGTIFGIDVLPERCFAEPRITCFCGKQQDTRFLESVTAQTGPINIVIDDGSHRGTHHVISFESLWLSVKPGGWYCIEDCQSLFNDCWTQPDDHTILKWLDRRWEQLLRGQTDINEVRLVGDGLNDGLIAFTKKPALS